MKLHVVAAGVPQHKRPWGHDRLERVPAKTATAEPCKRDLKASP